MCRTLTPTAKLVLCGRCMKPANPTDGWEHGWPLTGAISLGFPAQAFYELSAGVVREPSERLRAWSISHPAAVENSAQSVRFEWNHTSPYRLCYDCQKALLRVVGKFFGYGDPKREARWLKAKAKLAVRVAREASASPA